MLRGHQSATTQSSWHLIGVSSACVGVFAGGGFLYYRCVWYPRFQSSKLQALSLVPPKRRTGMYISGNNEVLPIESLHNLSTVVFYGLVVARVIKLFIHVVPLLWFAFLTYSLGFCSEDVFFVKIREVLSSMGPSYIKFGQWMATRPDFIPEGLCEALSQLYDKSTPHRWSHTEDQLRRIAVPVLENEDSDITTNTSEVLGNVLQGECKNSGTVAKTPEGQPQVRNALYYLCEIETVSVNSGSIAQVHKAKLRESVDGIPAGTEIAIKVTHPHIRRSIAADIVAMHWLVNVVTFIFPNTVYFDPYTSLREFSCLIRSQLNLLQECDNLKQFIFNFRDFHGVIFPRPLPSLCTEDVLVETFEEGRPLQEVVSTKEYRDVAERGCHMFLKMIFEDNFVHSDLHPGNVLLRTNPGAPHYSVGAFGPSTERYPDGKIKLRHELVVLDTGLVTTLSKQERENFIALFAAVACGDNELGADLILDHAPVAKRPHGHVDRDKFRSDMREIFNLVSPECSEGFRLSSINIGPVLGKVMKTLRENNAHIDGNFATLVLTIIVGEGLGRKLLPEYNIFAEAAPYLVALLEDSELYFLAKKLQKTYGTTALLRDSPHFVRPERTAAYTEALTKKIVKTFGRMWQFVVGPSEEDTVTVNG